MNYNSAFTGAEIDALLDSINVYNIESNTDLNSITARGIYRIASGTVYGTLSNTPLNTPGAGSMLIVLPFFSSVNVIQILICNQDSAFFIRKTYNNGIWGAWGFVSTVNHNYTKKGTTQQRPSLASNQVVAFRGMIYFDTTLGKPIWWDGDTSDGKSGWVDATGASV